MVTDPPLVEFEMQLRAVLDYVPRAGYLAKGIVYGLVGVLAVMVALGAGGKVAGSRGALDSLRSAPFGELLLAALSVGLLAYASWRLAQGLFNPESERLDGVPGLIKRVQAAVSGFIHLGLAGYTARLTLGWSSEDTPWSARLMAMDGGPYVIGAAGVVVGFMGLVQFRKAYTTDFLNNLKTEQMSDAARGAVSTIGRVGMTARGVVFLIVGWILIESATLSSGWEAQQAGLGRALEIVARQPYGAWLLGAVAVGVACYGVFCIVKGTYRRLLF